MKKIIVFLFLSVLSFSSFAQEENVEEKEVEYPQDEEKIHEIKINAFVLLTFSQIEASYEYLLNDESSVGVSVLIGFGNNNLPQDRLFSLAPYYRRYFSNRFARGFFIEGFGMLHNHRIDNDYYDFNGNNFESIEDVTGFSLGISVGGKFVSKKGFTTEISLGIGRSMGRNDSIEAVARGGVSLGYRF